MADNALERRREEARERREEIADRLVSALNQWIVEPTEDSVDLFLEGWNDLAQGMVSAGGAFADAEQGAQQNQMLLALPHREQVEALMGPTAQAGVSGSAEVLEEEGEERPNEADRAQSRVEARRFQEESIRSARRFAQERALREATERQRNLSDAVGMSADMRSRTDRFFVRTSDGFVVDQQGVPITEQRMQGLLAEAGLPDSEDARQQVVLQMGQRREVLGGPPPAQQATRENLGGFASADRLSEQAANRSVQTTTDGGVVMDINGMPMPGNDAIVPHGYRAYSMADAARPARMSAEEIGMLQAELVRSGMLTTDLIWGRWDSASQDAYTSLLTYANVNGIDVGQAFAESKVLFDDNVRQAVTDYRQSVEETAVRAVNMSTVREDVRGMFSTFLNGRTPSNSEMEAWSMEMADLWSSAAQQERQAAIAEAGTIDPRADIPEEFGGAGVEIEEPPAPSDEPLVDPQAQFAERFRSVYEKEQAGIRSGEESQRTQGLVASIGGSLISRAGGGI